MPAIGYRTISFELMRNQAVSAERGGPMQAVDRGPPRWSASFESGNLSMEDFGALRAWLASLRGASKTFVGFDRARRLPLSGQNATPSSWTVNTNRDEITLNGVGTLRLQPGDYIGLHWSSGAKRSLHRVLDDATASAGTGTWTVEPVVPAYVTSATAIVVDPSCIMRIVPDSAQISSMMGRYGTVSFQAVQVLEA
jgi:hypothetical protein